jgi:hypothetical protein
MISKRLFIFDKFISSIADKELSIIINPTTVPMIPNLSKRSDIKKPLSTNSYSLDLNSSLRFF